MRCEEEAAPDCTGTDLHNGAPSPLWFLLTPPCTQERQGGEGESETQQCVIEQAGCAAGLDVTTEFTTWLERHLCVLPDQQKKDNRRKSSLSSFKKKVSIPCAERYLNRYWWNGEQYFFLFFDTSVVWSTVGMGVPILLDIHRYTFQLRGGIDFMSNTPSELYVPSWSFTFGKSIPSDVSFVLLLPRETVYCYNKESKNFEIQEFQPCLGLQGTLKNSLSY